MNQPNQPVHPGVPIEKPDPSLRQESAWRLVVLKLFFVLFFVLIGATLVKIQLLEKERYQSMARKQYEQRFTLPGIRGNIYDRNGNVLVSNTMFVSFAADPKMVGNGARRIAQRFSTVFGRPASYYLERLNPPDKSSRRFVWLERHVRPEVAKRIESGSFEGIVTINEPKRLYHYDELAGPLLGFTNIDNQGISGLELQFDDHLKGRNGFVIMQRDGLGRARPSADYPRVDPTNGNHLTLTVDLVYQSIAEEELRRGVLANHADGGLALLLDAKTAEILALAHYPSINPNDLGKTDLLYAKNRIVADMFEPGSIFKVVTAAAAYEYNIVTPDKKFDAEGGTYRVRLPRGTVRLIKDTHEHDWLTFKEAMEVSSNIVMAKVSTSIGSERLYRQARDFGFGILTGVDLPGEVRGRLKKPHEWSGTTLQSLSYGYEVAVTPLQIVAAYAAVANNGVLMRPFIVREVRAPDGTLLFQQSPQRIRRVISEKTTALLTEALEGVVERGTAKEVRLETVRIAGKTGTSRKVIDGQYVPGNYTSSFVGYFPVEDPQLVCLVMMDNPRSRGYYGGVTSGPVFKNIAERIVNTSLLVRRTPQMKLAGEVPKGITVPDVRNLHISIAEKMLEGVQLKSRTFGTGDIVVRQAPEPGRHVEPGDVISLALNADEERPGEVVVPALKGMSVRRAMNRLMIDHFDIEIVGSGIVMHQSPLAGQRVKPGTTVRIICDPRPMPTLVVDQ
ncbi:MAG TPA: penicillin-binding transpeptidase domain-containing protein [Bacteroidota bacterium]|nr:penicillin-binding transpeptidase domain-containing protein [Bacteroidota bacterium]